MLSEKPIHPANVDRIWCWPIFLIRAKSQMTKHKTSRNVYQRGKNILIFVKMSLSFNMHLKSAGPPLPSSWSNKWEKQGAIWMSVEDGNGNFLSHKTVNSRCPSPFSSSNFYFLDVSRKVFIYAISFPIKLYLWSSSYPLEYGCHHF